MPRPWVKIYRDKLHSRSYGTLDDATKALWFELLLVSAGHEIPGDLGETEEIAWETRRDADAVHGSLEELQERGYVEPSTAIEHGWRISAWDDFQDEMTDADRKARQRRRKGTPTKDSHGTVTGQSRDSHAGEEIREEEIRLDKTEQRTGVREGLEKMTPSDVTATWNRVPGTAQARAPRGNGYRGRLSAMAMHLETPERLEAFTNYCVECMAGKDPPGLAGVSTNFQAWLIGDWHPKGWSFSRWEEETNSERETK